MSFDLYDVLDSAKGGAPPSRRSVDDIVAAGRGLRRRRRFTALTGGVAAALALAAGTAVAVPHLTGGSAQPDALAGAPTGAPATFPALTAPFMVSMKGYTVGPLHVSDPVLATAGYQEARITLDGLRKAEMVNSAETWKRTYDQSVGVLTVFRPGVFNPEKFRSGTQVQVHGRPGFQIAVTDREFDPTRAPVAKPSLPPTGREVQVPALAWQYADGAWATIVTAAAFKTADPAKDVLELAAGLTPAEPSTVKLPYRFGTPPTGYHLVAVGSFDPESIGEEVSTAYFAKNDVPMTNLTWRYKADDFYEARGGTLKIIVTETAPAAPSDPFPHPNPKRPCQDGFCDRAINDAWFAEVLEGTGQMTLVRAVTDGLVFDDPANPATWHDVTTAGLPE